VAGNRRTEQRNGLAYEEQRNGALPFLFQTDTNPFSLPKRSPHRPLWPIHPTGPESKAHLTTSPKARGREHKRAFRKAPNNCLHDRLRVILPQMCSDILRD
jgi:hypothetical protein